MVSTLLDSLSPNQSWEQLLPNSTPHAQDATAVLIFWDHREYVYFPARLAFSSCFKKMSESRFKVSKADTDGTKETKETYRRVNLSTDIQVNIIEPCKCIRHFYEGILKMDHDHV